MRATFISTVISLSLAAALALALLVAVVFSISAAATVLSSDWKSASPESVLALFEIVVIFFVTPITVIALLSISIRDLICQSQGHLATAAMAMTAGVLLANSWGLHAFHLIAMLFSIAAFGLSALRLWALRRQ